jgi:hypothetical protein
MTPALPVVDGLVLPEDVRSLLRPDEALQDAAGNWHILPRYFYEVADWNVAKSTKLAPHFTLAELMAVDCREADRLLRTFPHYVPCSISILARYLSEFRQRAGAPVSISVNGGYRSPSHTYSAGATPHHWGTAANVFRVGETLLDNQKVIEKYAAMAQEIGQEVSTKPFGTSVGQTDDHLHLDIGYLRWTPRTASESPPKVSIPAAS